MWQVFLLMFMWPVIVSVVYLIKMVIWDMLVMGIVEGMTE